MRYSPKGKPGQRGKLKVKMRQSQIMDGNVKTIHGRLAILLLPALRPEKGKKDEM